MGARRTLRSGAYPQGNATWCRGRACLATLLWRLHLEKSWKFEVAQSRPERGSLSTVAAGTAPDSTASAAQADSISGGNSGISHALLGMIIAAAVVLAAALGTTAFLSVHFYRAKVGSTALLLLFFC